MRKEPHRTVISVTNQTSQVKVKASALSIALNSVISTICLTICLFNSPDLDGNRAPRKALTLQGIGHFRHFGTQRPVKIQTKILTHRLHRSDDVDYQLSFFLPLLRHCSTFQQGAGTRSSSAQSEGRQVIEDGGNPHVCCAGVHQPRRR